MKDMGALDFHKLEEDGYINVVDIENNKYQEHNETKSMMYFG